MTDTHRITFILQDGIQTLDLFGPLEAFAAANALGSARYRWQLAAATLQPVTSESGARLLPDISFEDAEPEGGTVVFVGGAGPRTAPPVGATRDRLRTLAQGAGRLASICTGSFPVASLGLAQGRRMATHWRYADAMAASFPDVHVDRNALFVRDGALWSSAGVTAGIDMALAMISEDVGPATAAGVAREMVVYLTRPGHQAQFSEPLQAQTGTDGRLGATLAWIADHISGPISLDTMAARAGMSPRHFTRLFRSAFGMTPGRYVERLRLDRARLLLADGEARVQHVARAVGFKDDDTFRRAFERHFDVPPSEYRKRF